MSDSLSIAARIRFQAGDDLPWYLGSLLARVFDCTSSPNADSHAPNIFGHGC